MLEAIIFVLVIGLFIGAVILRGWALSTLWGWFAVPIFHLPALSIPQAIGVSIVVSLLTYQRIPEGAKDKKWDPIAHSVLVPLFAVWVGWIVKGYL